MRTWQVVGGADWWWLALLLEHRGRREGVGRGLPCRGREGPAWSRIVVTASDAARQGIQLEGESSGKGRAQKGGRGREVRAEPGTGWQQLVPASTPAVAEYHYCCVCCCCCWHCCHRCCHQALAGTTAPLTASTPCRCWCCTMPQPPGCQTSAGWWPPWWTRYCCPWPGFWASGQTTPATGAKGPVGLGLAAAGSSSGRQRLLGAEGMRSCDWLGLFIVMVCRVQGYAVSDRHSVTRVQGLVDTHAWAFWHEA